MNSKLLGSVIFITLGFSSVVSFASQYHQCPLSQDIRAPRASCYQDALCYWYTDSNKPPVWIGYTLNAELEATDRVVSFNYAVWENYGGTKSKDVQNGIVLCYYTDNRGNTVKMQPGDFDGIPKPQGNTWSFSGSQTQADKMLSTKCTASDVTQCPF